MAGLLDGVLPYLYSQSDRMKRHIGGLLSDPMGSMEQTGGQLQDNSRQLQGLLDMAMAGDKKAQGDAAEQALSGLLGFAPVGMTKVVGPQSAALETARRNAVKMLGLPENNTPMDRAKALGFVDEGLKHGTINDFPAFSTSTRHSTYATTDPAIADIYATATGRHKALREINAGPNVVPLMSRGNRLEVSDFRDGSGGWMGDNIAEKLGVPYERGLAKKLPQHGYDSMKVEMDDLGGRQTQYVFPEPNVLRSKFAAFDPARIKENDLLGRADPTLLALLGLTAGYGGYIANDVLRK